jgi:hypothetical protein
VGKRADRLLLADLAEVVGVVVGEVDDVDARLAQRRRVAGRRPEREARVGVAAAALRAAAVANVPSLLTAVRSAAWSHGVMARSCC